MTTANELIRDSARKAGILAGTETWDFGSSESARRELNRMLGTWSNQNLLIYEQNEETFSLVASTASYTIGSGATFDTVRPEEILEGTYVRVNSLDYPLKIISLAQYRNYPLKSTENTPERLAYNPTYPNGTIYLFYTPSSADTLYLVSLKPLTAFADLTTDYYLPSGYEDAIVFNLALRLGADYKKKIREDVVAFAKNALENIKTRNSARLFKPCQTEAGKMFGGSARSGEEIMATGPYY